MDGIWKVSSIACAGAAGNASVQAYYTGGASQSFAVFNEEGSFTNVTASGCRTTVPVTYSYSGSTLEMTLTGTKYCVPSFCTSGCSGSGTAGPYTYTLAMSEGSLSWISQGTADHKCTGASPAQLNPVAYSFLKQGWSNTGSGGGMIAPF